MKGKRWVAGIRQNSGNCPRNRSTSIGWRNFRFYMLHTNTVATEILDLIKQLQRNDYLKDFFLVIRDIKIDLLAHKYPLLNPIKTLDGIRLSSVQDVAAMKINAISIDGTRVKDFIDVYFLLDLMPVKELLDCYSKKYSMRNPMHALKSMQYFEDVDIADWPEMIKNKELTWDRVKKKIDQSCSAFIQSDLH